MNVNVNVNVSMICNLQMVIQYVCEFALSDSFLKYVLFGKYGYQWGNQIILSESTDQCHTLKLNV